MKNLKLPIILGVGLLVSGGLVAGLAMAKDRGFGKDRHHSMFSAKKIDVNNDGMISRDEMLARQQSRFDMLDTNKDGMIAPAEYNAKMVTMFEKLDVNADGLLQPDELPRRHHYKHHDKHKRDRSHGQGMSES
ncbi:EF-hand domain-containing protein [Candidatus Puniceispirillum marinum]|uniref:EF-hand domain-containing protein n=1 Tax=Puniceispirillum marinum (strain IMCC1322) TaxID=488538 RepID=D5BNS3_PUNMI|nr:hypothetical protein [Candidatus Puniceispirillum marinum]ADE38340.1 hypothetical protein SAR116_0097 [Candidatus Puniceispirillum marinum IMCC1322]